MEKTVNIEKELAPFLIDIDELEKILNNLLKELFDNEENPSVSIHFRSNRESFTFDGIEEIRRYIENESLPKRIDNYHIYIRCGNFPFRNNQLEFHSNKWSLPTVTAISSKESWCAGAIATVTISLRPYRMWYHWISLAKEKWAMISVLLTIWCLVIVKSINPVEFRIILFSLAILLLAVTVIICSLFFLRSMLPLGEIRISKQKGFFRRKGFLFLKVVSIVITIIAGFLAIIRD